MRTNVGSDAVPKDGKKDETRALTNREHIVRQDRYEINDLNCSIEINGTRYSVLNYSSFGIAVLCDKAFPDAPFFSHVPFFIESHEISILALKLVRSEKLNDQQRKIAFEIIGSPLSIAKIDGVINSSERLQSVNELWDNIHSIPEKIRGIIYDTRDLLEAIEDEVNELNQSKPHLNSQEQQLFEEGVIDVTSKKLHDVIQASLDTIEKELSGKPSSEVKACFEFYRAKLKHLIFQSPFASRSVEKPLGYAGDFEMMRLLYWNENIGSTLFAKCLHRCLMDSSNARAVRNRASYLTKLLLKTIKNSPRDKGPLKILSVACGPAEEIKRMLEHKDFSPELVELHLLDQDLSALRAAQLQLKTAQQLAGKLTPIRYWHKSIKNLILTGANGTYDLIYSAGLFDYLSDPVASMAAIKLREALNPGGKLIIGNFTAAPKVKTRMELLLDWSLIYRNEEDLRNLYGRIDENLVVEPEPEGINLFVHLNAS